MSKTHQGRKQYKSMRGKAVDMDLLRKRNELTPAVGNAKVNARGDELGPGGKIVKKREEVVREYYSGPNVAKDETRVRKTKDEVVVPAEVILAPPADFATKPSLNVLFAVLPSSKLPLESIRMRSVVPPV